MWAILPRTSLVICRSLPVAPVSLTGEAASKTASLGFWVHVGRGGDPLLRLYQSSASGYTTTRFAYDGMNMIAEYDPSGTLLKRHVFGPGADEALVEYDGAGTKTYLAADERGSIIARTNGSGVAISKNSYDEYGIPGVGNTGRFQYTGQAWLPELGMQYSKARIYSPTLGRFMQTDPIGYGDGMNMYAYVKNDPVNGRDPTGLNVSSIDMRPPVDPCKPRPGEILICADMTYTTPSYEEPAYTGSSILMIAGMGQAGAPQNKQCPAPAGDPGNVSLSGKLTGVADVMGGFKFTGTLTDTRPGGLSVAFEATGVAVGFAGGVYDVQGTVPGFDALDSTFQISFFNAGYGGFGVSGARISRGDLGPKGAIGEISVSNGPFAPLLAGAAAMKFNGGVKRTLTGNRFGC